MMINPLVVVTVSRSWNSIIEQNFQTCIRNGVKFVWINHFLEPNKELNFEFKKDSSELIILNVECGAEYVEAFLYRALKHIGLKDWCLLIAGDELISSESISKIIKKIDFLNEKTIYAINRLWIMHRFDGYYYSNNAAALSGGFDYQFRLFKTSKLKEDSGLHTPGFKVKKSVNLELSIDIIHLIWELEDISQRIDKIKKYDSISMGGGRGKLRYYLPELFLDSEHRWTKLDAANEGIVDSWKKIHYLQI
jgi:hypothetical protein